MKPFNLTEYFKLKKKGEKPRIITREGLNARIICTDKHHASGCIVALINDNGTEYVQSYHENGNLYSIMKDKLDLFFADLDPEPKYRPYKDAAECFQDIIKHGGWYRDHHGAYCHICKVTDYGFSGISLDEVVKCYTWVDDGSPCGVKED